VANTYTIVGLCDCGKRDDRNRSQATEDRQQLQHNKPRELFPFDRRHDQLPHMAAKLKRMNFMIRFTSIVAL